MLAVAAVASVGALGAWFPASALLNQRTQLDGAAASLQSLDHENAALRHEVKQLQTPQAVGRIAQQQYDLVAPGAQAYQVLPPSGSATTAGALLITRPASSGRLAGTAHRTRARTGTRTGGAMSGGFLARVVRTLEFWR